LTITLAKGQLAGESMNDVEFLAQRAATPSIAARAVSSVVWP
jgi:hypothetical protein